MTKKHHTSTTHHLALRVCEIGQLFNSMDPTPFINKDLDRDAEDYIESWAAGYSSDSRFQITIHLEVWPEGQDPSITLSEAIHNHFAYKGERTKHILRQLLRQGRTSLLIGIVFLSLCLLGANALASLGNHPGYTIAEQSLTIVGWVAMWRPMQIFLYEWWPLLVRVRLYKRLSQAHIHTTHGK
ncbi:MAG: hypothetical protein GC149_13405 [Gammaproteobacteria bacterium]|nr:hypothetical protein [Gammaproteobacteria bacterium]